MSDPEPTFRLRTGPVPPTADIVIVGAGVIGCATAFFATAAGLRTVVLDARPQPATLTTAAATGAYRLQHDNAEELALVREGVDLLFDFAARAGLPGYDIRLRPQGYLFCTTDGRAVDRQRRMVERQHAFGLTDVELLSGDETRARFPYISPDVVGARYRANDGFIDQVRVALGYALAASNGSGVERPAGTGEATFCLGERATGLRVVGGRIVAVETPHASIAAPIVVLATGPFLARTAGLAGVPIALAPTVRRKVLVADLAAVPAGCPRPADGRDDSTGRAVVVARGPGRRRLSPPRSRLAGLRCPDQPVLGGRLERGRRLVHGPGRPVRDHPRPPAVRLAHADPGPLGQRRI